MGHCTHARAMPMPSDAETIEAMGAERLEGKSDAVVAYVASRHAVITLRLAIAAERIADALEAIATRPGGMG